MTVLRGPGRAVCPLRSLSDKPGFFKAPFSGRLLLSILTGTTEARPASALAPVRECERAAVAHMGPGGHPKHS